jgi:hypothetical protein
MSSSRSIAAARNRRAGEQAPTSRPGTSIAAQPAFSQQTQSKKGVKANTSNTSNSTPNVPVTNTKLTISDAIGLITLRLGRVEQIIMEIEHNGGISTSTNIPDNTHLVDKSVINSIVNRLDSLEKKEKESSSNQQTSKLENELRDIKDLLMSQILKYEKFTMETNKRFEDVDEAFVELEKQQEILNECNTSLVDNVATVNDETIISGNLKSVIEQELADSQKEN